jgi:hypothetical protein
MPPKIKNNAETPSNINEDLDYLKQDFVGPLTPEQQKAKDEKFAQERQEDLQSTKNLGPDLTPQQKEVVDNFPPILEGVPGWDNFVTIDPTKEGGNEIDEIEDQNDKYGGNEKTTEALIAGNLETEPEIEKEENTPAINNIDATNGEQADSETLFANNDDTEGTALESIADVFEANEANSGVSETGAEKNTQGLA